MECSLKNYYLSLGDFDMLPLAVNYIYKKNSFLGEGVLYTPLNSTSTFERTLFKSCKRLPLKI